MSLAPTIVLVHGAFADASSWHPVIERLLADGHRVCAPPVDGRSLTADADAVRAFVERIDGPVLLAGHSYGGAVITVAAAWIPAPRRLWRFPSVRCRRPRSASRPPSPPGRPGRAGASSPRPTTPSIPRSNDSGTTAPRCVRSWRSTHRIWSCTPTPPRWPPSSPARSPNCPDSRTAPSIERYTHHGRKPAEHLPRAGRAGVRRRDLGAAVPLPAAAGGGT
ncbi:alpha/beta fold hydrolase [Nocardia rhamnosiphila]|uniref:alpha/beta fold hydrolase n=1 Tax=Nocardia rhamnosiphila TaxID=426716 RepID=UPI0033DC7076